jgi:hypothetical protein
LVSPVGTVLVWQAASYRARSTGAGSLMMNLWDGLSVTAGGPPM